MDVPNTNTSTNPNSLGNNSIFNDDNSTHSAPNFIYTTEEEGAPGIQNYDTSLNNNGESEDSDNESETNKVADSSNKRIILQRFTIYNSESAMYIVGGNPKETLFRVLEIGKDARDSSKIFILEDKSFFYTRKDMIELINALNDSIEGGIHKIAQGYGLLGLIRFTKGYYLSLITKCSQVAVLGGHYIYHVDESKLVPLDMHYVRPSKYSDEERLLSIFRYLDLGKTFYFSYAYDITNTLQTTFMRYKRLADDCFPGEYKRHFRQGESFSHNDRFVWNKNLLKPVIENSEIATYEWFQPIIHGFVDQASISIYGRKFYITIIARRSQHFAGARFLKRGVNDKGNVANEVETEQIVSDMLTTPFHDPKHGFYNNPRYTSYVQHRGSIPLFWTQDLNRLPKPPIEINLTDPYYQSAAMHFNNLFERYESPIIILNLIKTKEKHPRESILNKSFIDCVSYLNHFLPEEFKIRFYSFDMSRHTKKGMDVIKPLQIIADRSIKSTGFFHNGTNISNTKLQTGIIRTNCIDCLDRTNAAQFIICKEALKYQLSSLKLISESTTLEYDSDLINILTEMFHDHGDTIAIQYGGSNLVNTMDSYRRINQWSSHTRDMINSVKRIYSNSFMDSIRQEAINLFLGNYIYDPTKPKLWELQNDFHLHNDMLREIDIHKKSYIHWYNDNFLLQSSIKAQQKGDKLLSNYGSVEIEFQPNFNDNWTNEYYAPRTFQTLSDLFQFNMNSNARYFPTIAGEYKKEFNYSPFRSRKLLHSSTTLDRNESASKSRFLKGGLKKVADEGIKKGGSMTFNDLKSFDQPSETSHTNSYLSIPRPYKIKNYLAHKMESFSHNKALSKKEFFSSPVLKYRTSKSANELENNSHEIEFIKRFQYNPVLSNKDNELYSDICDFTTDFPNSTKASKYLTNQDSSTPSSEDIKLYKGITIYNDLLQEELITKQKTSKDKLKVTLAYCQSLI